MSLQRSLLALNPPKIDYCSSACFRAQLILVLATILSRCDLAQKCDRFVKPVRRGITLTPARGEWLIATAKKLGAIATITASYFCLFKVVNITFSKYTFANYLLITFC